MAHLKHITIIKFSYKKSTYKICAFFISKMAELSALYGHPHIIRESNIYIYLVYYLYLFLLTNCKYTPQPLDSLIFIKYVSNYKLNKYKKGETL